MNELNMNMIMNYCWNHNWQGKQEVLWEKPLPLLFVHHKFHISCWYKTWVLCWGTGH